MEKKIRKLLFSDCVIIVSILVVLWLILCFVMAQVSAITPNHSIKTGIMSAGLLAGAFSTAASIAVLIHLRTNQKELYSEELLYREIND